MRYSHFLFLFLIALLLVSQSCQQKKAKKAIIEIHFPQAKFDTVTVGRISMVTLDGVDLGKIPLDSNGNGTLELELEEPVFAFGTSKYLKTGFYIAPGDRVGVIPSEKHSKHLLKFQGNRAAFNEYLKDLQDIRDGLEKWNGTYSIQLEGDEFLKAKDSLQRSYDHLIRKMKSDKAVSKDEIALMEMRMRNSVLAYQFNFSMGRDSTEMPVSVRRLVQKLPIDTVALNTGVFDYGLVGSFFFQTKIINEVYDEHQEMDEDSFSVLFPELVDKDIKRRGYPKKIEDFLRIKAADFQIRSEGLSKEIESIVAILEKEVASEEWKDVIRATIAKWAKIGPGKPAPDFVGTTPGGKQIALSDLRGKIVYVDIWATWCGPCVDEFRGAKKLVHDFKGNDQVAFLYVSVDRDTLAWKNMVAAGKVPAGIHVIDEPDSPKSVWNQYYVWGIPRYLLIDAAGRIVAAYAARPSSGKVQGELRKLLAASPMASR